MRKYILCVLCSFADLTLNISAYETGVCIYNNNYDCCQVSLATIASLANLTAACNNIPSLPLTCAAPASLVNTIISPSASSNISSACGTRLYNLYMIDIHAGIEYAS